MTSESGAVSGVEDGRGSWTAGWGRWMLAPWDVREPHSDGAGGRGPLNTREGLEGVMGGEWGGR